MHVCYMIEYFRLIHKLSDTLIRPPAWYTCETTAEREVYIVWLWLDNAQYNKYYDVIWLHFDVYVHCVIFNLFINIKGKLTT